MPALIDAASWAAALREAPAQLRPQLRPQPLISSGRRWSLSRKGSAPGCWVSVVIATYNRQDAAATSARAARRADDRAASLRGHRRRRRVEGGHAREARRPQDPVLAAHRAAGRTPAPPWPGSAASSSRRGRIIVVVDDDMQVAPTFLEKHLDAHDDDDTVVLGRLRPDAKLADMPLFERFYARVLADKAEAFAAGKANVRGHDVYTGNVSFPRKLLARGRRLRCAVPRARGRGARHPLREGRRDASRSRTRPRASTAPTGPR